MMPDGKKILLPPAVETHQANPVDARLSARWLVGLAVLAALYRIAYVASVRSDLLFLQPVIDAAQHDAWAIRIAQGCLFGAGPDDVFKPPLYPSLVGLFYAVVGHKIIAVQIMQSALGVVSTVLTAMLAARLFGRFVGIVAGLIAAFYAPFLFFEGQLLTPALSVALNLTLVLLALRLRDRGPLGWIGLGLLAGVASAVRPDAILAAGILAIWCLVRGRRTAGGRGTLIRAGLFLGGLILVLGAVTARNYALARSFIPVSANAGINFYTGNGPGADGVTAIPTGLAWSRTIATIPEETLLHPSEASRLWFRRSFRHIADEPGAWVALLGRKAAAFWSGHEFRNNIGYEWYRARRSLLRAPFVQYWPVAALALIGIGLGIRRRREHPEGLAPALVVVAYFAAGVAFFVTARYRIPVVPFCIILAASTIGWMRDRAARALRELRLPALLLAGAVVLTWPGWMAPDSRASSRDHINLGNVMRGRGDVPRAMKQYERARALNADDPDGAFLVGTMYLASRRPAEAVPVLLEALEREPESIDVLFNLAEARRTLGEGKTAHEAYAAILAQVGTRNLYHKRTTLARAYLGLHDLLVAEGRSAEAETAYESAWDVSERTAAEYAILKRRDLERAETTFRRVADEEPWGWYQRANVGLACFERGRFDEAAIELRRAAGMLDAGPGVRLLLAKALRAAGRPKEARAVIQELLDERPGGPLEERARRALRGL